MWFYSFTRNTAKIWTCCLAFSNLHEFARLETWMLATQVHECKLVYSLGLGFMISKVLFGVYQLSCSTTFVFDHFPCSSSIYLFWSKYYFLPEHFESAMTVLFQLYDFFGVICFFFWVSFFIASCRQKYIIRTICIQQLLGNYLDK
jgi:hypothetical protein